MSQPGILMVSGTNVFECHKTVNKMVDSFQSKGWVIERLSALNEERLRDLLSAMPMFGGEEQTLAVVSDSHKVNYDLALHQHNDPNPFVTVVLLQEGKAKGSHAKLAKNLPAQCQLVRNLPPRHEAEQAAADFCIEEARGRGLALPYNLALALVRRCGTDYWYLHHEVMKACDLSDVQGCSEITPRQVALSTSALGETPVGHLIDSVSLRDSRGAARAFVRIRTTHGGNPTVKVCRFLLNNITTWITVADLKSKGYSESDAAGRAEVPPWVYRNILLPAAERWDMAGLKVLLREVSLIDRAARSGAVDPWSGLVAAVLRSIGDSAPCGA